MNTVPCVTRRYAAFTVNCVSLLPCLLLTAVVSHAQPYPTRPIRWIVPFAPGGPTHLTGEVLRSMTHSHIVHVPFKGNAQALTELMSGIIKAPDMQERFVAQGVDLASSTPDQFVALIKAEVSKWRKIVQESGAKVD